MQSSVAWPQNVGKRCPNTCRRGNGMSISIRIKQMGLVFVELIRTASILCSIKHYQLNSSYGLPLQFLSSHQSFRHAPSSKEISKSLPLNNLLWFKIDSQCVKASRVVGRLKERSGTKLNTDAGFKPSSTLNANKQTHTDFSLSLSSFCISAGDLNCKQPCKVEREGRAYCTMGLLLG